MSERDAATPQPMPTGAGEPITPLVIREWVARDWDARKKRGVQTYGTELRAFNGRDALWDAYEEAQDEVLYLRQAIYERDALAARLREIAHEVAAGPRTADAVLLGHELYAIAATLNPSDR